MSRKRWMTSGMLLGGLVSLLSLSFIPPTIAADSDADLVKRGEYLATVGDCVACHTAPGGEKFAGGLYMPTPVGKISTPNITPDKATGIGNWTDDQFYRALHEGIDAHDQYLYPVFPFPWFTKVKKDDALAIKAYLFSLKPVNAPRKPIEIGFPFDIRTGLLTWRTLFFKEGTFKPNPKASDEVNRGAYLVEGLGHCGECHNKENLFGASVWSGALQGGQISGWYAPNITSDGKDGVGRWKAEDIVTFLKTGARPNHETVALGPMAEVIHDSTSKMTDQDLTAIASYLKSTTPEQTMSGSEVTQTRAADAAYLNYCSSCHQADGKGVKGAIPGLAGNGAVTAKGPENVIRVVLGGLEARTGLAPMPAFGQRMSDAKIAEAVNYVRTSWGNAAPANALPATVAGLRKDAQTMLAMNRAEPCAPYKDPKLEKAVDAAGVKAKLESMDLSDMLSTIHAVLPGVRQAAPGASPDQITNAMIAAYCPVAREKVPEARQSIAMGDFAVLTYGEAKKNGKVN